MITIPLSDILAKIKEKSGMSDEDIEGKIKQKMDQLSGLISKEGAAHIIANEVGVQLVEKTGGRLKIDKVLPGMRSVEIVAKVLAVYEVREFESKGRSGKVGSFMCADETGTVRVAVWGDKADTLSQLKQDDIVKLTDAYVKDNQGRKELHMNDRSIIEINPEGETLGEVVAASGSAGPRPDATRKQIKDLVDTDQNVELLATVVQVFDPRFFERKSDKSQSFVLNAFLDDGTDSLRAVFFGDQALKLLSMTHENMMAFKESLDGFQSVKDEMLGVVIKVSGRASRNEMFDRIEFIVNSVDINPDPEQELKKAE